MNKKYTHNNEFFKEPNVINSYWAGFIAADGCITGNSPQNNNRLSIGLKSTDAIILEKFIEAIDYTGKITHWQTRYTGKQLIKYGNKVFEHVRLDMNSFGENSHYLQENFKIGPRKSLTLEFPDHLSDDCKRAFIVGYSDGDGSLRFNKYKSCRVGSFLRWDLVGTQQFLQSIKDFLNIGSNLVHDNTVYRYFVSKQSDILSLPELLQINKVPYLERKWNKIDEYRKMLESVAV